MKTQYDEDGHCIVLAQDCGCYWDKRVPKKEQHWKKCEEHALKDEVEKTLIEKHGIPECPECGADVRRHKCLFDYGGSCPRHEVANMWNNAVVTEMERRKI